MRRSAAVVPVLVFSIALSGCSSSTKGSGSSKTSAATSTSASASSSAATSSSSSGGSSAAPDAAKLKTFVLTQADVPAGWKGAPSTSSADNKAQQAKLEQCLGVPDSTSQQVASVDSDDFALNDSTISSNASSFPSQAIIDRDVQALTGAKATTCFKQSFQSALNGQLPAGATVTKFDLTVTPGPNGGPSNVVAQAHGQIAVLASGQTVSLYVDVAFITGKLVEAEVDFLGFGQPIDQAAQTKAITAVATRIAAG